MRAVKDLLLSRENSYKFLLRSQEIMENSGALSLKKLIRYLSDNEKELIERSIDVSKISYNIDTSRITLSSFVGLFWFTDDYKQVTDIIGVKEFSPEDVAAKLDVFPDGFHSDYESDPSYKPRGRVSLSRGNVIINVGLKCPDSAINPVIEVFGLKPYEAVLHIGKGYHWDTK